MENGDWGLGKCLLSVLRSPRVAAQRTISADRYLLTSGSLSAFLLPPDQYRMTSGRRKGKHVKPLRLLGGASERGLQGSVSDLKTT